jgi:hypothetical protein
VMFFFPPYSIISHLSLVSRKLGLVL